MIAQLTQESNMTDSVPQTTVIKIHTMSIMTTLNLDMSKSKVLVFNANQELCLPNQTHLTTTQEPTVWPPLAHQINSLIPMDTANLVDMVRHMILTKAIALPPTITALKDNIMMKCHTLAWLIQDHNAHQAKSSINNLIFAFLKPQNLMSQGALTVRPGTTNSNSV